MANSTSPVPQVVEGTGAVDKVNGLNDANSQGFIGGRDDTSSLLNWKYLGGRINGINVANGNVTLTVSTTNYVVMKKSDGVVSVSTTTTNWDDSGNYWRLYSVVTDGTTWTSYNDERSSNFGLFGVGSPAGLSNPMTDEGDIIVGSTGGTPARLAISTTAGEVLTSDGTTAEWAPPRVLQNSQSSAYTLVLADAGKHLLHPSADTTARIWTIPANASVAFPIGTAVTFVNQNAGGAITIAITSDTMRLAGPGSTGSRTLAANGIATALKITSTEWIISGSGLT